ncbi:MAG TPA: HAMP domain-containing histidine kinase [Gammaproteobacteria bacterium]|nr:HAMP domain-containing histidine kinase [Gammaproteobacteria bacterium]
MSKQERQQTLDFASVIASAVHDMKNSLTLLLDTLDDTAGEPGIAGKPLQEKLLQAQHEGKRLNRNLIQLLALYRMERAQMFVNISENYVAELLEDVAMDNRQLLSARNIKLEIDCPEDLVGYFDRELVTGILNTIINNSYRYTRDTIRLSGENREGYLGIHVEDNGPGYPEKMLHASGSTGSGVNFQTGSTGLGLYFAAQVAQMHRNGKRHGHTQTDNKGIDGGGRFSLYLP